MADDDLQPPPPASSPSARRVDLADERLLAQAWEQVRANRGAAGVDGVTIHDFEARFGTFLAGIQSDLLAGSYRPSPVRAVEFPKPSGGVRILGIPTVRDRVVTEAISRSLAPLWEPTFSSCSFAYRPGRGARDAVAMAQRILQSGQGWVVDLDVEKFFDNVDHVRLMLRLAQRTDDASLLDLIGDFLRCGRWEDGVVRPTPVGLAQGSPLSPLLSNVVLDELDKEFERRGWPFVRYADDCILFAPTCEVGRRILDATSAFLSDRLRLRLHPGKSRVVPPSEADHLGFTYRIGRYGQVQRRVTPDALKAFRARVDDLASARPGDTLSRVADRIATFVRGWSQYYGFCQDGTVRAIRAYARDRIREAAWHLWRTPERRRLELERAGVAPEQADRTAFRLRLPGDSPGSTSLVRMLPDRWFDRYGLGSEPAPSARENPQMKTATHPPARDLRPLFRRIGRRLFIRPQS